MIKPRILSIRTLVKLLLIFFILAVSHLLYYFTSSSSIYEIIPIHIQQQSQFNRLKILLSPDKYTEHGLEIKNSNLLDKRLLPLYWLYLLNNENVDQDFKLPFNWNLLTQIDDKIKQNRHYSKLVNKRYNCEKFFQIDGKLLKKYPNLNILEYCIDEPKNQLPLQIIKKMDIFFQDFHFRTLYNMLYALNNFPVPQNVLMLTPGESIMVPLREVDASYYTNISNHIIQLEQTKNSSLSELDVLKRGVSIPKQLSLLQIDKFPYETSTPDSYIWQPTVISHDELEYHTEIIELDEDLFQWDLAKEASNLRQEPLKTYLSRQIEPYHESRFFGVSHVKDMSLDHYDWRFFNGDETFKTQPEVHIAILHRLSRTWFYMCQKFNVATWLNHGPLIGWYWNGASMPFDSDLDLQIPIQSLHYMLKFLNDTLVYDFQEFANRHVDRDINIDNYAELGMRSFYFEINNNYPHRNRFDGNDKNNIDARLIDVETGVYIDITLLLNWKDSNFNNVTYELQVLQSMTLQERERFYKGVEFSKFYDNIYQKLEINNLQEHASRLSELVIEDYKSGKYLPNDLIIDRNYHAYHSSKLRSLIPIFFENYPMFIPKIFLQNIISEYSPMLITSKEHKLHRFFPSLGIWVNYDDCPYYHEANDDNEEGILQKCLDYSPQLMRKFLETMQYTEQHKLLKDLIVDWHNVGDPQINTTRLTRILQGFKPRLLRPEVWSMTNLFDIDINSQEEF